MKPTFSDYLKAAFSARPYGLFVPPNWIGLGAFGLLGTVNPGYWLLGAGLELAYLLGLSHAPRFRAIIDGRLLLKTKEQTEHELDTQLARLDEKQRARFAALRTRCDQILQRQDADASTRAMQAEGLGKLLNIYLRLLLTQSALRKRFAESDADPERLQNQLSVVEKQLAQQPAGTDLRHSYEGQLEILRKRQQTLLEGAQKLAFTESEADRIEQQIALIRDQVGLSAGAQAVGEQIDQVSSQLGETSRWISEQNELFGADLGGESLAATLASAPIKQ